MSTVPTENITNISNISNSECSEFDHESDKFRAVAFVSVGSASLSTLACIAVIFTIFFFKKYIFFTHRLVLYLILTALFSSLAVMARLYRVAPSLDSKPLKMVCMVAAFFEQTASWSELIAYVCLTFNLFMIAAFNKRTERLEPLYFLLIFVLPLTVTWIPFIKESYGEAGAWCWIRDLNEDCSAYRLGTIFRYVLWTASSNVVLVLLVVSYIALIIIVYRQKRKWTGNFDPEVEQRKEMMKKEVWPLLFIPIVYFFIGIFPIINRVVDTIQDNEPVFALWILHAAISPLQGGYVALIYILLDHETFRRLKCTQIIAKLCKKETEITEYPVENGFSDSLKQGLLGEQKCRSRKESEDEDSKPYFLYQS